MNSPVAHAQFRHPLTISLDVLRTEVMELVFAAERAFPTLSLHVHDELRHSSLHLFVMGHPRLVTMLKVRLLYRGWKLVGRIRIAEEVAVRPTVSRADDRNMWVSVASPAHNTRTRALTPTWHIPTRMGQSNTKKAQDWARQRSASLYGLGLPYGPVAAHVAGLVHEQKNSSEMTPSPERTPYETPVQWTQRKRRTQAMRTIEKRKAAISAVEEQVARTTRKQTGPKER
jgi:hypothetical protein